MPETNIRSIGRCSHIQLHRNLNLSGTKGKRKLLNCIFISIRLVIFSVGLADVIAVIRCVNQMNQMSDRQQQQQIKLKECAKNWQNHIRYEEIQQE